MTRTRFPLCGLWRLGALLVALPLFACAAPEPEPTEISIPEPGTERIHELSAGQRHVYGVELAAGDVLRVEVVQEKVDARVSLETPRGSRGVLRSVDGLNADDGPEYLVHRSGTGRALRLVVQGLAGSGTYRLRNHHQGPATEIDRRWLEIEGLVRGAAEAESLEERAAILEQAVSVADSPAGRAAYPDLLRARLFRDLGNDLRLLGRLRAAEQSFLRALELFESHGNAWEQGPTLLDLSDVYFKMGDLDRQEQTCLRALEAAEQVGHRNALATGWSNLGVHALASGRPARALFAYRRALSLRQGLDPPTDEILLLRRFLGYVHLSLGQSREGLEMLEKVVVERRRRGGPVQLANALLALADARRELLDPRSATFVAEVEEVLELFDGAVSRFEAAGDRLSLAAALERRANLLRLSGRFEAAAVDLDRAAEALGPLGDDARVELAWLELALGALLRETGHPEEAFRQLTRARQSFQETGSEAGRLQVEVEQARVAAELGDLSAADAHWSRVVERIESGRLEIADASPRGGYLARYQPLYAERVQLLATAAVVDSAGERWARRSFTALEQKKGRALLDRLAVDGALPEPGTDGAEVRLRRWLEALEAERLLRLGGGSPERGGGPAVGEGLDLDLLRQARSALEQHRQAEADRASWLPVADPVALEAVQGQLGERTAMLLFSLHPERSFLWWIERDRVEVHALDEGRAVGRRAERLHESLARSSHEGFALAARHAAGSLASLLVPVADRLPELDRLVVVPDGPLHRVPFGFLPWPGEPEERLADRVVLSYAPSASVWVRLRERRAGRSPASSGLAVVADPVFSAADPRVVSGDPSALGLERLPAGAEEAARLLELASAAGESAVSFTGFAARRELLTEGRLSDFRGVHLATHGLIDSEDPRLVGLAFSLVDESGRFQDGFLRRRDLDGVSLGADLVVLSACSTALGQPIRGEGLVGLAHGFFSAGAGSLVASLWDVDDAATAELMSRFYERLFAGLPVDEALSAAQRSLRQETPYRSARHWAGFVVLGDGDGMFGR